MARRPRRSCQPSPPGRPEGLAACACGLRAAAGPPSRFLPALGGGLEAADSSTTSGRCLVLCFHVTLSETGRGVGLHSQSAPTTTQASRAARPPGGRRLGGGPGRGDPGPRPQLFSAARRPPPPRPGCLSERTEGASLRAVRRAGCWAAHLPVLRPRRPWTWWPPARWAAGWAPCSPSCSSWWTCSTKVSPALPPGWASGPSPSGERCSGGARLGRSPVPVLCVPRGGTRGRPGRDGGLGCSPEPSVRDTGSVVRGGGDNDGPHGTGPGGRSGSRTAGRARGRGGPFQKSVPSPEDPAGAQLRKSSQGLELLKLLGSVSLVLQFPAWRHSTLWFFFSFLSFFSDDTFSSHRKIK